jgi:TRAP-type C4-dicarboxylate transport system substrate-binding protein
MTLGRSISVTFIAAALAAPTALSQERVKLKAIGQPVASGLIQKNKEQPFFETLAQKSGLPIEVDYKPIDTTGIKDVDQLRVMDSGLFEVVSLRMSQISRDEPMTLGLDLTGQAPDFATARAVTRAFSDVLDRRLQQQHRVKLLGVWPAGPQVLFCKKPIAKLADVKGLKVRVYDQVLAKFFSSLGATPVPISFPETHQSLSLGVVDCAITGPASANSAGWPEVTTHVLPLSVQFAMNGYGITLAAWKRFSPDQQAKLQAAFTGLVDEIWRYSEELATDAMNCNTGKEPCKTGKRFALASVPVSKGDVDLVRNAVKDVSLPAWSEQCDKVNRGCSQSWRQTVGPIVGIK